MVPGIQKYWSVNLKMQKSISKDKNCEIVNVQESEQRQMPVISPGIAKGFRVFTSSHHLLVGACPKLPRMFPRRAADPNAYGGGARAGWGAWPEGHAQKSGFPRHPPRFLEPKIEQINVIGHFLVPPPAPQLLNRRVPGHGQRKEYMRRERRTPAPAAPAALPARSSSRGVRPPLPPPH